MDALFNRCPPIELALKTMLPCFSEVEKGGEVGEFGEVEEVGEFSEVSKNGEVIKFDKV